MFVLFCNLKKYSNHHVRCILFLGQFIVPSVSGQCCPPISNIAINKIDQNKGVMFGGQVAHGDPTNNVYIFNVTHNAIVSYYYLAIILSPVD